jgi:hypothetical protein
MKSFAKLTFLTLSALALKAVPLSGQQPPVLKNFWPDDEAFYISEGQSLTFTARFGDETDPDSAHRGMSNVVWRVDGVPVLEATEGAPGPIMSVFVFHADHSRVSYTGFRDFEIRVVGSDLQGDLRERACWVNVAYAMQRQTITFGPLPEKTMGDADFSAGATASSGLPLAYTSSNESVAQIVNGLIHLTGAGTAVIAASQPGNTEFLAAGSVSRILTVRASLSAEVLESGGVVTGTGLYMPGTAVDLTAVPADGYYFQQWENGSHALSRRLVMPVTNVQVSATFSNEVPPPELGAIDDQRGMVGVGFAAALPILSDCRPTVRVTGLPRGLTYNATTRTIEGVPRAACSNRLVTVTVTNPLGASVSQSFVLTVEPLPEWARGTFTGYVNVQLIPDWVLAINPDLADKFNDRTGGLAILLVAANGKVSGKLRFSDTTISFASDRLGYCEGLPDYPIRGPFFDLWLPLEGEFAGHFLELTIVPRDYSAWLGREGVQVGQAGCGILREIQDGLVSYACRGELYQDGASRRLVAAALSERYAGYYTASLDGGPAFGSGYLTLAVSKRGGVSAAGKLGDGTAVSLTGQLVFDADGRVWAPLLATPSGYKGGGYFAVVEWVRPDGGPVYLRLRNGSAVWVNRNPQATAEYGAGFTRTTGLTGGWYDRIGNLSEAYRGKALSLATDNGAPEPLLQSEATEYYVYWWRPDEVPITANFNRRGEMTMTAPAPTPLWTADGAFGSNPLRLAIALNRSTGVFKGSFTPWFCTDVEFESATFLSKKGPFEGVLLPGRADASDGVEGRGSFLWSGGRGRRMSAAGRESAYAVTESYDLRLLSQPAE